MSFKNVSKSPKQRCIATFSKTIGAHGRQNVILKEVVVERLVEAELKNRWGIGDVMKFKSQVQ